MKYTNSTNIPLAVAVFLATDDYDYEPNTVSATSLLKPIRQFILAKRVAKDDMLVDIGSMVSSRMGSAIHTAIEKAWMNPEKALTALGYPNKVAKNIVINPNEIKPGQIPIYMEQRAYRELQGYTISGKYDFVGEGKVQDFKSTSVYTYLNQTNKEKYQLQGSIYRWLNPEIITKNTMDIHFFFTDWNKKDSLSNPSYPPNRVLSQSIPLLSLNETENFVRNKLSEISKYKSVPEIELPHCTDEELWRKETIYKYYRNPANTARSTKNFKTYVGALNQYVKDGSVGLVQEVKGTVSACKYCNAFALCSQAQQLIESGDLVL